VVAKPPPSFVMRSMRRLSETLQLEKQGRGEEAKNRCYYENADEINHDGRQKERMKYDKEKNFGVFGKAVLCDDCYSSDPSSSQGSESE
jgi:hypothetical protein